MTIEVQNAFLITGKLHAERVVIMVKEVFGQRLKALRVSMGVSQQFLSFAAGVSSTQISAYERGVSVPFTCTVVSIAEFFGVTVDYLVGLSDSPELCSNGVHMASKRCFPQNKKKSAKVS